MISQTAPLISRPSKQQPSLTSTTTKFSLRNRPPKHPSHHASIQNKLPVVDIQLSPSELPTNARQTHIHSKQSSANISQSIFTDKTGKQRQNNQFINPFTREIGTIRQKNQCPQVVKSSNQFQKEPSYQSSRFQPQNKYHDPVQLKFDIQSKHQIISSQTQSINNMDMYQPYNSTEFVSFRRDPFAKRSKPHEYKPMAVNQFNFIKQEDIKDKKNFKGERGRMHTDVISRMETIKHIEPNQIYLPPNFKRINLMQTTPHFKASLNNSNTSIAISNVKKLESPLESTKQSIITKPNRATHHYLSRDSLVEETQSSTAAQWHHKMAESIGDCQSEQGGSTKYSLRNIGRRKGSKNNINSRTEVFMCMKYSDLGKSVKSSQAQNIINEQIQEEGQSPLKQRLVQRYGKHNKMTVQPSLAPGTNIENDPPRSPPTWSKALSKYLCSTFKGFHSPELGCPCEPKCHWMQNWLSFCAKEEATTDMTSSKSKEREKAVSSLTFVGMQFRGQSDQIKTFHTSHNLKDEYDMGYTSSVMSSPSTSTSSSLQQILKDIPRTQSEHPTFQTPLYRSCLRNLLQAYLQTDPQIGYVQGMNILASVIVYHGNNQQQCSKVMQLAMITKGYRKIYKDNLEQAKKQGKTVINMLKEKCFDLWNFLAVGHGIDLEMFVTSWYFSMFGSFIPLDNMHLVLNKFIIHGFAGLASIIITLFLYLKDQLMSKGDDTCSIMSMLSNQSLTDRANTINWQQIVDRSRYLRIDRRNFQ